MTPSALILGTATFLAFWYVAFSVIMRFGGM